MLARPSSPLEKRRIKVLAIHVALTGGIASGKSAVAERLAELGAIIIDSDQLSREVVEPGSTGLAEVVARFGVAVLDTSGALDRAALAKIVFADSKARADLEAIVHPRVRARAAELAALAPADAVVVHVIPLLVETGQGEAFDQVIVVDADPETQIARLRARDGLDAESAESRMAVQATRETRLAHADLVIENRGSAAELQARVDRVWAGLARRTRSGE